MPTTVEQWIGRYQTDFGFTPTKPPEPTDARPGSPEKVEILRARIASGEMVHAVGDDALCDSCGAYARAEISQNCWVGTTRRGHERSHDGKYLYRVRRIWDPYRPVACVIGRNPPMSDQRVLRTIREQVSQWGCGGLELVNLFALRTDDPNALGIHDDPIGPVNDRSMMLAIQGSAYVIFAWGRWGAFMGRGANLTWAVNQTVSKSRIYCLGLTRSMPSALEEDKRHPQPVEFMRAFQPWTPRLLPYNLVEKECILRS